MSRITKFLRQQCKVQTYQVDNAGKPKLNQFGEIQYNAPKVCKCRHEISYQDVQVANGSLVKSTSRYFFDTSVEMKADYLVDGRSVLSVSTFVNQRGDTEGYEVYV